MRLGEEGVERDVVFYTIVANPENVLVIPSFPRCFHYLGTLSI